MDADLAGPDRRLRRAGEKKGGEAGQKSHGALSDIG